jgi:hypothetical protein
MRKRNEPELQGALLLVGLREVAHHQGVGLSLLSTEL